MSTACPIPSVRIRIIPAEQRRRRHLSTVVRSANAEGPLRRPAAPPLAPKLQSPAAAAPPPPAATAPPPPVVSGEGAVTLEYQRKRAKEMQQYFRQKKLEEADQGPFFGFLPKNEISNGRWAMFGFAVGLLTEYATGADFVQQMKILLANFGIVDLD
ncbi:light-harvesting complex-like protein OHP2, chloroplastic [Wolffia australiana]